MWGSCGGTRLLTLQKLQTRAARIVTNSSYDACADALIEKLNEPIISKSIKRETMNMVYKSLNDLIPMYLSNTFSRNSTRETVYLRNSESDLRAGADPDIRQIRTGECQILWPKSFPL